MKIINLKKLILKIHKQKVSQYDTKYWYKLEKIDGILKLDLKTINKININKNLNNVLDIINKKNINLSNDTRNRPLLNQIAKTINSLIVGIFIYNRNHTTNMDIYINNVTEIFNSVLDNDNCMYNIKQIYTRILSNTDYDDLNSFLVYCRHIIIFLNTIDTFNYKNYRLLEQLNLYINEEL